MSNYITPEKWNTVSHSSLFYSFYLFSRGFVQRYFECTLTTIVTVVKWIENENRYFFHITQAIFIIPVLVIIFTVDYCYYFSYSQQCLFDELSCSLQRRDNAQT
jgi:hypothetical protein